MKRHIPNFFPNCFLAASLQFLMGLPPAGDARAQTSAPPIQTLRAPDKTRWEITIQPKTEVSKTGSSETEGGKKTDPKPVAETAEKDGSFYHFRQQFRDGTTANFYALPQLQFLHDPESGRVTRRLADEPGSIDLAESDFPELYWVIGQPVRREQINGTEFLIVEIEGSAMPPTLREKNNLEALRALRSSLGEAEPQEKTTGDPSRPSGLFRLFLDPKTRLPLRLETPAEVRIYQFSPSAGLKGKLPESVAEAVRSHEEALRPPSAP